MTEKKAASNNEARVAILVPKTPSGFFSALSLKSYLSTVGITEVLVIEARPCHLKLAKIPNHVEEIYVAGLGERNCPLSGIEHIMNKHGEKIKLWVDNHPEGKPLSMLSKNIAYLPGAGKKAPSCAAILQRKFGETVVRKEWLDTANHFENGHAHQATEIAHTFTNLLRIAEGREEEFKELYSRHLLAGEPSIEEIIKYLGV